MNYDQIDIDHHLDEAMPSAHEQLELRRAMIRERVPVPDMDSEWQKIVGGQTAKAEQQVEEQHTSRIVSIWKSRWTWMIAASVALILVIKGIWGGKDDETPTRIFAAIAKPTGITLRVAQTGEGYILPSEQADSFLQAHGMSFDNERLACSAEGEDTDALTLLLETSRGRSVSLLLADGTTIDLNAETVVTFPSRFTGSRREVRIEGEGFFAVAKDKAHPFVVENPYFTTTVRGTSFNIRCYADKEPEVTLVEGCIALTSPNHPEPIEMVAGEKAVVTKGQPQPVKSDAYDEVQWRDGLFYFDNTELITVLQELGRWYNVDIITENPNLIHTRLHFVADKSDSLSATLTRLNDLGIAKAILEDGQIVIK